MAPSAAAVDRIEFRADDHTYWLDGRRVYSVTQILEHWSGMQDVPDEILIPAAQRGTNVHEATHLDDLDDLNEEWAASIGVLGYVMAWRKFRRERKFTPSLREHRVYHVAHNYAGTLDAAGSMEILVGRKHRQIDGVLVDIKSGVQDPVAKMQTAAYAAPLGRTIKHRGCAYLHADGTYDWVEHPNHHEDWADFLACRRHFAWKHRNNLLTRR